MKQNLIAFLLTSVLLVLVSCTPPAPDQHPSPPPPLRTATPQPTSTAVPPTPTAAPTHTSTPDPLAISPQNAERLVPLAQFGNGLIDGLAWSPDGQTFVVGSTRGLHFYDRQTLEKQQVIPNEDKSGIGSMRVKFGPPPYLIVTHVGWEVDSVVLLDGASGETIRYLDNVIHPTFTADGSLLFYEWDNSQFVWQEVASGNTLRSVMLPIQLGALHAATQTAAEIYLDKTVRLYDLGREGSPPRLSFDLPAIVDNVVFSPSGDLLAVSSRDGRIRLWDTADGKLRHDLTGSPGTVSSALFSPDGRLLATSTGRDILRVWDTQTGTQLFELALPSECSGLGVVAFSPDGQEIAAVIGNAVTFFALPSGEQTRTLTDDFCLTGAAFLPTAETLLVASGSQIYTLPMPHGPLSPLFSVQYLVQYHALSPDGARLAWYGLGEEGPLLQIVAFPSGQPLVTHQLEGEAINALAFSADGQRLATRSGYGSEARVQLWAANSGDLLATYPAYTFAFTPDGRQLALSIAPDVLEQTAVELWDTNTQQLTERFDRLILFALLPDGRLLAANRLNAENAPLGWYDTANGSQLRPFANNNIPSRILAHSPSGRLMLGLDNGMGNAALWDTTTDQTLQWDGNLLRSGDFSPDGRFLVTTSVDGQITLWGLAP